MLARELDPDNEWVWPGHEKMLLDLAAAEAPHSSWVVDLGPDGVWVDLVARFRRTHPDAEPLVEPALPADTSRGRRTTWADTLPRFHRLVLRELARRDEPPLERVQQALDLSVTDLGRLFGVTRQAAAKWLDSGEVPGDRQTKLVTLAAVVDLLERKLKAGRLPGVARRSADVYGGLTMLEMVEQGRESEVLDRVRESFDWSAAA